MAENVVVVDGEEAMLALGGRIAALLRVGDVIALEGGLGAGKTTLARGILTGVGLESEAPSPSFAIVQPYAPPEVRVPVAHVDLYRLDGPDDVRELALEEYLEDGVLIVEWPDRLGTGLWADSLHLAIDVAPDGARRLTARIPECWRDRWPQI